MFGMKTAKLVVAMGLAAIVTGCGDKPLTDEQKARVSETFGDVSQSSTAMQSSMDGAKARGVRPASNSVDSLTIVRSTLANTPYFKKMPAPVKKIFGGFVGLNDQFMPAPGVVPTFDNKNISEEWINYRLKRQKDRQEKLAKLEAEMEERYVDGSCTLPPADINTFWAKASSKDGNLSNVRFRVMGEKCPYYSELRIDKAEGNDDNFNGQFTMMYEIKDAKLLEFAEVTKMEITFTITSSNEKTEDSTRTVLTMGLNGPVTTKTEGEVTMKMDGRFEVEQNQADNTGKFELEFNSGIVFKDFEMNVETTMNIENNGEGAPVVEFSSTINGEELTLEDVNVLMSQELEKSKINPAPAILYVPSDRTA